MRQDAPALVNRMRQSVAFSGGNARWRLLLVCLLGLSTLPFEVMAEPDATRDSLTVGGGCFWCVEAVFERRPGVLSAVSGYAGGKHPDPTYEMVCSGRTGHAEVVQITFEPDKVSLAELFDLFFLAHDPTTLNRQGADVGPQYRSIILFANEAQKKEAEAAKARAQASWSRPIVTEIVPLERFYPAEDYHQDYFQRNPNAGYCALVIRPKLRKLEQKGAISPE